MAHSDHELTGDLDRFITHLDRAITGGSVTANIEAAADHRVGDARMSVRVYERYSAIGGNRLSLSVSVLSVGDEIRVSMTASGGSSGLFWKVNTFGEAAFLDRALDAIGSYAEQTSRS